MTRKEFDNLPRENKYRYVWSRCSFLATRFHRSGQKKARVNLFYNGHFYIEVYYNGYYNYFGDIISFEEEEKLTPYLDTISLQEIMVH